MPGTEGSSCRAFPTSHEMYVNESSGLRSTRSSGSVVQAPLVNSHWNPSSAGMRQRAATTRTSG